MSRWVIPILLVVFAVAARAAGPKAGCPRDCCVVSGDAAFCLGTPELVAGQYIESISWAPTGRALVARRDTRRSDDQPGEIILSTWNMASHRLTDVLRRTATEADIGETDWFASTSIALVAVRRISPQKVAPGTPRDSGLAGFLCADAARGQSQFLAPPPGKELVHVSMSPKQPVAVVTLAAVGAELEGPAWLWVVRSDGTCGMLTALPHEVLGRGWSEDGRQFLVARQTNASAPGVKPTFDWFGFDPSTGHIAPCSAPGPARPEPVAPEPYSIEERLGEARAGSSSARVPTIWMQSSQPDAYPRALVATSAASAELSPTRDAVAYRVNGSLWVRPIVRKTVEQFEKEYRDWATGAAKQLNLAIMMYVQDYDEIYPLQSSVMDSVMPYLKDAGMLGELHFALNGEKLADIATPVNFELGYVDGPGGRAVMYADGHVKWQPRK